MTMKSNKTPLKLTLIFIVAIALAACENSFLDVKPTMKQRVPETLDDYEGLLNAVELMNVSSHALGMIGADEFYVSEIGYHTFPSGTNYNYQKRAYTWQPTIFEGGEQYRLDWNQGYERILLVNLVLEGVKRLDGNAIDRERIDKVKGEALFHRAWNYYNLAQLFSEPYHSGNGAKPGVPLRLEPDLTTLTPRSDLKDTYNQIVKDLREAETLLPDISESLFKPDKRSVHALLARLFLQIDDFEQALAYANLSLGLKSQLIDFNGLDMAAPQTFMPYGDGNPEIIFMATCPGNTSFLLLLTHHYINADTVLLDSYELGDLRKQAFWAPRPDGTFQYKGSYEGSNVLSLFTGLAVDEVYLIRAECSARLGDIHQALTDYNTLRANRFSLNNFHERMSDDPEEVLGWILEERRKELVFRGTRWEDLRRLNREERYAKTLVRKIGDKVFELPPGNDRYTWPIPLEAVQQGGYEQNLRQ